MRVVVPEHKARSVETFNVVTSEVILQKTLPRKLKAAVEADNFERDRNYWWMGVKF